MLLHQLLEFTLPLAFDRCYRQRRVVHSCFPFHAAMARSLYEFLPNVQLWAYLFDSHLESAIGNFAISPKGGQNYACAIFRFRSKIEVILLKFYRDSLPCVVILGVAEAIRQPCERFGMEILKNMAMRQNRAASNPTAAAAWKRIGACGRRRRYKPGDGAGAIAPRRTVLPVSFR